MSVLFSSSELHSSSANTFDASVVSEHNESNVENSNSAVADAEIFFPNVTW